MAFLNELNNIDYSAFASDPFLADPSQTDDNPQNASTAIQWSEHSLDYQLTTLPVNQDDVLITRSYEGDTSVTAMAVDSIGQASDQNYSGSQSNVDTRQSTLMDEGLSLLDWSELSLATQDHYQSVIQSTSMSTAQPDVVNAGFNCDEDTVTCTPSAVASASAAQTSPVSATRSSPSQSSVVGHIHFCAETRGLVFRCIHPRCRIKPFRRPHDFDRHYNSVHATIKNMFWCPVVNCSRGNGKRPFPRKDKMMDHARKVHGVEAGDERDGLVD